MQNNSQLISITMLLLVASGAACKEVLAGQHYTIRVEGRRELFSTAFSPDSQRLAVKNTKSLYLVNVPTGDLIKHQRLNAISVGFTITSHKLFVLMPNRCAHYDADTGERMAEKETRRPWGYVGTALEARNGKLLVNKLVPGSPAAKSGEIGVGDEIVGYANGQFEDIKSLVGASVDSAVGSIRGVRGSSVRIQYIPKGSIDEKVVLLQRSEHEQRGNDLVYLPFEKTPATAQTVFGWLPQEVELWNCNRGRLIDLFELQHVKRPQAAIQVFDEGKQLICIAPYRDPPDSATSQIDAELARRRGKAKSRSRSIGDSIEEELSLATGVRQLPKARYYGAEIRDITTGKTRHFPVETSDRVFGQFNISGCSTIKSNGEAKLVLATARKIRFYDIQSGEKLREFEADPNSDYITVNSMAASNKLVAAGNIKGKVRLLTHEGEFVREIENRETGQIESLKFSPDGKWLAYVVSSVLHLVEIES